MPARSTASHYRLTAHPDHPDPAAIRASTERLMALRNAALREAKFPRSYFFRRVKSHPVRVYYSGQP